MTHRTTHPDHRVPAQLLALCVALAVPMSGGAQGRTVVPGWQAGYAYPDEYSITSEPLRRTGGEGLMGIGIASTKPSPEGSALLVQSIRADDYRGRRIRFAAWLRATDVSGQSGLFARVDGAGVVQTSDYMIGRTVDGTTMWTQYAVVLDVPADAIGITFGLQLTGSGELLADDASFETVGVDVAATGGHGHVIFPYAKAGNGDGVVQAGAPRGATDASRHAQERAYARAPLHPSNLDFEQVSSSVNR